MGEAEMARMLKTAKRIAALEQELSTLRKQLRADVTKAHESGETVAQLARSLGVTRSRIYQLLGKLDEKISPGEPS
jgi:DNA-binding MarR family transcriptional regulator